MPLTFKRQSCVVFAAGREDEDAAVSQQKDGLIALLFSAAVAMSMEPHVPDPEALASYLDCLGPMELRELYALMYMVPVARLK